MNIANKDIRTKTAESGRIGGPPEVETLLDAYKMLEKDFGCDGTIGKWVSEEFRGEYIYPKLDMLRRAILNLCGFECNSDHEIPDALYDLSQFDSREGILKAIEEVSCED